MMKKIAMIDNKTSPRMDGRAFAIVSTRSDTVRAVTDSKLVTYPIFAINKNSSMKPPTII